MADHNHLRLYPPGGGNSQPGGKSLIRGNSVVTLNQIYDHHNTIPARNRILHAAKSLQQPSIDVPDCNPLIRTTNDGFVLQATNSPDHQQSSLEVAPNQSHQNLNQRHPSQGELIMATGDPYGQRAPQPASGPMQQRSSPSHQRQQLDNDQPRAVHLSATIQHQSRQAAMLAAGAHMAAPANYGPVTIINVARRHKKRSSESQESPVNYGSNPTVGPTNPSVSPQQQQRNPSGTSKTLSTDSSSNSSSSPQNGASHHLSSSPIMSQQQSQQTLQYPPTMRSQQHPDHQNQVRSPSPMRNNNSTLDAISPIHSTASNMMSNVSPTSSSQQQTLAASGSSPRRRILPQIGASNQQQAAQGIIGGEQVKQQQQYAGNHFTMGDVEGQAPTTMPTTPASRLQQSPSLKRHRKLPQIPTRANRPPAAGSQPQAALTSSGYGADLRRPESFENPLGGRQAGHVPPPLGHDNNKSVSSSGLVNNPLAGNSAASHHVPILQRQAQSCVIGGDQLRIQSFPLGLQQQQQPGVVYRLNSRTSQQAQRQMQQNPDSSAGLPVAPLKRMPSYQQQTPADQHHRLSSMSSSSTSPACSTSTNSSPPTGYPANQRQASDMSKYFTFDDQQPAGAVACSTSNSSTPARGDMSAPFMSQQHAYGSAPASNNGATLTAAAQLSMAQLDSGELSSATGETQQPLQRNKLGLKATIGQQQSQQQSAANLAPISPSAACRGRRLSSCGSGSRANFLMNKQHAIGEFTPPRCSLESSMSRGSQDWSQQQQIASAASGEPPLGQPAQMLNYTGSLQPVGYYAPAELWTGSDSSAASGQQSQVAPSSDSGNGGAAESLFAGSSPAGVLSQQQPPAGGMHGAGYAQSAPPNTLTMVSPSPSPGQLLMANSMQIDDGTHNNHRGPSPMQAGGQQISDTRFAQVGAGQLQQYRRPSYASGLPPRAASAQESGSTSAGQESGGHLNPNAPYNSGGGGGLTAIRLSPAARSMITVPSQVDYSAHQLSLFSDAASGGGQKQLGNEPLSRPMAPGDDTSRHSAGGCGSSRRLMPSLGLANALSIDVYHCGSDNEPDDDANNNDDDDDDRRGPLMKRDGRKLANDKHHQVHQQRCSLALPTRDRQPSNASTNSMPAGAFQVNPSYVGAAASSPTCLAPGGATTATHLASSASSSRVQQQHPQHHQRQEDAGSGQKTRKFGAWALRIAASGSSSRDGLKDRLMGEHGARLARSAGQLDQASGGATGRRQRISVSSSGSGDSCAGDRDEAGDFQGPAARASASVTPKAARPSGARSPLSKSPILSSSQSRSASRSSSTTTSSYVSGCGDSSGELTTSNDDDGHQQLSLSYLDSSQTKGAAAGGDNRKQVALARRKLRSLLRRKRRTEKASAAQGAKWPQQLQRRPLDQATDRRASRGHESDQLTLSDKLRLAERSAGKLFRKVELSPQGQLCSKQNSGESTSPYSVGGQPGFFNNANGSSNFHHQQQQLALAAAGGQTGGGASGRGGLNCSRDSSSSSQQPPDNLATNGTESSYNNNWIGGDNMNILKLLSAKNGDSHEFADDEQGDDLSLFLRSVDKHHQKQLKMVHKFGCSSGPLSNNTSSNNNKATHSTKDTASSSKASNGTKANHHHHQQQQRKPHRGSAALASGEILAGGQQQPQPLNGCGPADANQDHRQPHESLRTQRSRSALGPPASTIDDGSGHLTAAAGNCRKGSSGASISPGSKGRLRAARVVRRAMTLRSLVKNFSRRSSSCEPPAPAEGAQSATTAELPPQANESAQDPQAPAAGGPKRRAGLNFFRRARHSTLEPAQNRSSSAEQEPPVMALKQGSSKELWDLAEMARKSLSQEDNQQQLQQQQQQQQGKRLDRMKSVITAVSRRLEPLRGMNGTGGSANAAEKQLPGERH